MAAHAPRLPIAVFHEHPNWFTPLFAELDRRGLSYRRVNSASHSFDPAERSVPYSLVFNRASPSAYLRGHTQSLFYTLHWLRHLELLGVPVVNGADVYGLELSKALQLDLLEELGLPYPRARVINDPAQAPGAAAITRPGQGECRRQRRRHRALRDRGRPHRRGRARPGPARRRRNGAGAGVRALA